MRYKFHKTSLKRGSSYIKSPEWIANKKATINPKNTKCNCCFAYPIIVALNHQNIKNHTERIVNIIPFMDKYNWEHIDFPAGIRDWKKIEKNNETIALNILQVPHEEKNIIHVYKSKYNHSCKNQVVLLMITDGEKWHYTALTSEQTEKYLDANNLYGWPMCKKLTVNGFKWVTKLDTFNEDFIKNYNEDGDVGYFLDVDTEYPKNLHKMHSDLPFLPEQRKIGKTEKLVCGIEDKEKYVIHINTLKQALNHGLRLINVHRVIEFNQEAW